MINYPLHHAVINGNDNIASYLLQRGAAPDTPDPNGYTPLHHAVINGNYNIASSLLHHAAAPDTPDPNGYTPLHYAVINGHSRVVESLKERTTTFQPMKLIDCAKIQIQSRVARPLNNEGCPQNAEDVALPLPVSLKLYALNPLTL